MVISKDKILMESLYETKGYGMSKLLRSSQGKTGRKVV